MLQFTYFINTKFICFPIDSTMSPALATLQFAQVTRPGCLSGRIPASIQPTLNAKREISSGRSSAHLHIQDKRIPARISKLRGRSFSSCVVGSGDRAKRHRREIPEEPMELEILGMSFGCVLGALQAWKLPNKDCLLPLVSKVLGYCIVAASTTVKLPQVPLIPNPGLLRLPYRSIYSDPSMVHAILWGFP